MSDDRAPGDLRLHQDFGRLEGQVSGLTSQMNRMQGTQDSMQEKVDAIHDAMMLAKGGWRMLFVVGSVSGAMGAFLASIVGYFRK